MPKSKAPSIAAIDPTIPFVPITLGGKEYRLIFTFKALAIAEAKLREQGIKANLIESLDLTNLDAGKIVSLLYAAMLTAQPAISPTEVADLITFKNLPEIIPTLYATYAASIADVDPDAAKAGASPLDTAE